MRKGRGSQEVVERLVMVQGGKEKEEGSREHGSEQGHQKS